MTGPAAAPALELLREFVEEPGKAARTAAGRRPIAFACLCYALAGLSLQLALALKGGSSGLAATLAFAALLCLWQVAAGFVMAAVLHLLAEALPPGPSKEAPGSAGGLFVMLGLSELAWTLALPAALLLRLCAPNGPAGPTALLAAGFLLSLGLRARSVRDLYGLPRARAWLYVLFPYVAVTAAIGVFVAAAAFAAGLAVLQALS